MDVITVYKKDADEKLNYEWDWTDWLEGNETISTVVFTIESGLTLDASSNTTTTATALLSGGTVKGGGGWTDPITGEVQETHGYTAACRVTTNGGQIGERTILIQITEK